MRTVLLCEGTQRAANYYCAHLAEFPSHLLYFSFILQELDCKGKDLILSLARYISEKSIISNFSLICMQVVGLADSRFTYFLLLADIPG